MPFHYHLKKLVAASSETLKVKRIRVTGSKRLTRKSELWGMNIWDGNSINGKWEMGNVSKRKKKNEA